MNAVDQLYNLIDKGREGKNIGIRTGLDKLDEYTGGIQRGIYSLIFGLSGSGKTALVLYSNIYRPLKDNPNINFKIIYYSLEMSTEVLLSKILCMYIYEEYNVVIPYDALLSWKGILSDEWYEYVQASRKWLLTIIDKFIIFDKSLNAKSFYASTFNLLSTWGKFTKNTLNNSDRTIYTPHDENQYVWIIIDHLGLVSPANGRTKKMEIDEISSMAVGFRNKCNVSFYMLMQENRNSSGMDRRNANMAESSANDIQDSSAPLQDSDICIGLYNPIKHKVKTYRDYKIIVDSEEMGNFKGLRDRFRSALLIKNRYGQVDKAIGLNFFGELSVFYELPKGDSITDYSQYLRLPNQEIQKSMTYTKEDTLKEDKNIKDQVKSKYSF